MPLSPIIEFMVSKETSFPAPSEKEKLDKAIRRFKNILLQHPQRSDINEIRFGLADMLVGRNEKNDYAAALKFYEEILEKGAPPYLRARALIGKAELSVPIPKEEEKNIAIEMCHKAEELLDKDMDDFFGAKVFMVEADLLLSRDKGDDHARAYKICEKLIKNKGTNLYFKARALLCQAELILYHFPQKIKDAIKFCQQCLKLLEERKIDYFYLKGKIILAELLTRRAKKDDFKTAQDLCREVIRSQETFTDLLARAKLLLAELSRNPKALELYKEIMEMEVVDPYIIAKTKTALNNLKEKLASPKPARLKKKPTL